MVAKPIISTNPKVWHHQETSPLQQKLPRTTANSSNLSYHCQTHSSSLIQTCNIYRIQKRQECQNTNQSMHDNCTRRKAQFMLTKTQQFPLYNHCHTLLGRRAQNKSHSMHFQFNQSVKCLSINKSNFTRRKAQLMLT